MRRILGSLGIVSLSLATLGACDGGTNDEDLDGSVGGGGGADADADADGSGGTAPGTGGGDGDPDAIISGTELYDCAAPSGTLPALKLEPVADGFNAPVLATHAPGDAGRLFVVEQEGIITVLTKTGDTFTAEDPPFLDIVTKVTRGGSEQGLLGLAFHPDYENNGLFYVHYSAANGLPNADEGDTIIEEYQVSADANIADVGSARRVLRLDQPSAKNHNGGTITFGPEGYLFIALGDGGADSNTAQDVTNLFGSILRIDPTGDAEDDHSSPADNLQSVEPTAAPEIWSYGFRNPYRM
ncbi:MAG TPA: PQQ-dependent sugar dehydrogenase, partial [Polyangiaceae bacterium]|nr:PQQ-dependent sugar dehydrogenase [Polyangiaceae bacterium]